MEAQLQGDNLPTMGKGKGRVSALFLTLKKEKTMDSYRKMNAFLTDADIMALQELIHCTYNVQYVEIGNPNVSTKNMIETGCYLPTITMPIVHTESDALNARMQGILLRLSEALENKETIFE